MRFGLARRRCELRGLFMSAFAVMILGLLLLQTVAPAVAAQEQQIAYDNGIPGGSVSLPYTPTEWAGGLTEKDLRGVWVGNHLLAVRFTSDNSTMRTLLRVSFYIAAGLESFNVWAFDSDRNFLTYSRGYSGPSQNAGSQYISGVLSWTVTPASIGWVDLNVSNFSNPIFVSGDFYVAIEFTVDQEPRLGVDTTGPKSNRSWVVENQTANGWIPYSTYAEQYGLTDGNLMIRAVTGPLFTNTTGNTTTSTTRATPGWELPTSIAITIYLVAAVVVWQVRKRR